MLKEWLSKIFNKNKLGIQTEARTTELISILDVIDIPTREYLENKELLDLIDKYEHEYIAMLNSKKHIVHTDFNNTPLKDEMVMNVDLILNVLFGNPFHIYENEGITDIDILKLEIYRTKLQELKYETLAKIVALKEILQALKEKRRTRTNKIERVASEIESLTSMLVVFESQKRSIEIEQKTYVETHEVEETDEEKTLIKLERVEDLAKVVIPEKLKVLESVENIKVRIALIERELEIYAYRSQDKVPDVDNILQKLQTDLDFRWHEIEYETIHPEKDIYRDGIFDDGIKKLYEQTTLLEKEVLVYAIYGRNLIKKSLLEKIYQFKFNVLTLDINRFRKSPVNDKTNDFEYECYKDIVMKKIEVIIRGNNPAFNSVFGKSTRKAIKLFKEALMENNKFNPGKILNDPERLAFVLAFYTKHGLEDYYNRFEVPKSKYMLDYYEGLFRWKDELPLDTIYRIAQHSRIYIIMDYRDNISLPMIELYKMVNKEENLENRMFYIYHFPKGLIEFAHNCKLHTLDEIKSGIAEPKKDIDELSFNDEEENSKIIKYLATKIKGSNVRFPESFKASISNFNDPFFVKPLIEPPGGIKSPPSNNCQNIFTDSRFIVPSIADPRCFDAEILIQQKVIYFYDYKNSKILNNKEYLLSMLKMCFDVVIKQSSLIMNYNLTKIILLDENLNEVREIDLTQILKEICQEIEKDWKTYDFFTMARLRNKMFCIDILYPKIMEEITLANEQSDSLKRSLN